MSSNIFTGKITITIQKQFSGFFDRNFKEFQNILGNLQKALISTVWKRFSLENR